ncbi:MAG: hypothetical protein AB2L24_23665 [Mangrovibacterium sp.]
MKNWMFKFMFFFAVAAACGSFLTSCNNDDETGPLDVNTRAGKPVVTIPANTVITTNTTWSSSNDYLLQGKVWVSNNAILTIEAGTTVRGAYNATPAQASALIITRGSQLIAKGTGASPIIMTADETHQVKGGWGGLVLLGNAQINQPANQQIEGISTGVIPPGVNATYGTNITTYNGESSGWLEYVRVEYAGATIATDNELNAFTFGGVGSGTKLEHCQAYYGADDGFEFFGGTVTARYLVATACDDDAFDFDFGYQGKIQFAVATIDASQSYSSNPNGIECDNDGSGSSAIPKTHPYLSNFTIVGTSNAQVAGGGVGGFLKDGAHFRRATEFTLKNSILYGFNYSVQLESASSTYTFGYNVVYDGVADAYLGFTGDATNSVVTAYSGIILTSPFGDYYNSNALKPTGNPALTGANFDGLDSSFFTTTSYKGAVAGGLPNSWLQEAWIRG